MSASESKPLLPLPSRTASGRWDEEIELLARALPADLALRLLGTSETPVWSSLRHYDSHMIDALRGRGFSVLLTQLLLVKELAIQVPAAEKGLVPSFG